MSQKIAAADELRKFGRAFRNVLAVCDDLDKIGSVENAAQEAESRHQKALADVREAEQQLLNKQSEYAELEGKVRYAATEAARIVSSAVGRMGELKEAALNESNTIVVAAKQEVELQKQIVAALKTDIAGLIKTKQEIEAEVKRLNEVIENARAVARKIIEG